jgi:hypothetical protein
MSLRLCWTGNFIRVAFPARRLAGQHHLGVLQPCFLHEVIEDGRIFRREAHAAM